MARWALKLARLWRWAPVYGKDDRNGRDLVAVRMGLSFVLTPGIAVVMAFPVALVSIGRVTSALESASVLFFAGAFGAAICSPVLAVLYALIRCAPIRAVMAFGGWPVVNGIVFLGLGSVHALTASAGLSVVLWIGTYWALASATIWLIWQWRRPLRLA